MTAAVSDHAWIFGRTPIQRTVLAIIESEPLTADEIVARTPQFPLGAIKRGAVYAALHSLLGHSLVEMRGAGRPARWVCTLDGATAVDLLRELQQLFPTEELS